MVDIYPSRGHSTSVSQPARSHYDPTSTGDWDYNSHDHTHSYATYALHTTAPKRLPMINPDLFMTSEHNDSDAGMLSWMHTISSKQISYHRQQMKFHQKELEYWQDLALMALDLFRSKGTQEDYAILTERTYATLRGAHQPAERYHDDAVMSDDDIPQPISHLTLDRPPLVRPTGSRFRSRRTKQTEAKNRTKQFLKQFADRIQKILRGVSLVLSPPPTFHGGQYQSTLSSTTLPPKRAASPSPASRTTSSSSSRTTSSPSASAPNSPQMSSTTLSSHSHQNSISSMSITLNPVYDNPAGASISLGSGLKPARPAKLSSTESSSSSVSSLSSPPSNSNAPTLPKKPTVLGLKLTGVNNDDSASASPPSGDNSLERSNSVSRNALLSPSVAGVVNNQVIELPKPKNPNSAGFQNAMSSAAQQAQVQSPTSSHTPALPQTRVNQQQRDSLIQIRQAMPLTPTSLKSAQFQFPSANSVKLSRNVVEAAISPTNRRSKSIGNNVGAVVGTAKALYSYVETTHGAEYLSFKAGDVVNILDDGSNVPGGGGGWWLVDLQGAVGYVPSNFFARLDA